MVTTHKIKTWVCSSDKCKYHCDFDPTSSVKMALIHPGVPAGKCAACWNCCSHTTDPTTRARLDCTMILETDTTKQITITIITDEEIDDISDDEIESIGKTKAELKSQAVTDRAKYDSSEWKAL